MLDDLPDPPAGIWTAAMMKPEIEAIDRLYDIDNFRAAMCSIADEDQAKAMVGTLISQVADRLERHAVPRDSVQWWCTALAAGFRHEWDEAQRGRPSSTVH